MGPLGIEEFILIIVAAIIIYGGSLPSMLRDIGKYIGKLKRYFDEAKSELESQIQIAASVDTEADNPKKSDASDDKKEGTDGSAEKKNDSSSDQKTDESTQFQNGKDKTV